MATSKKDSTQVEKPQMKYRYSCHGCTKNAGLFFAPVLNQIVRCPHCGMEQLTKLENFIAL